jgi:hypothetical protein
LLRRRLGQGGQRCNQRCAAQQEAQEAAHVSERPNQWNKTDDDFAKPC